MGSDEMTVGFSMFMFFFGLLLLVWGSSLFVDSAVTLANHFHVPEVLIGATIVSIGTTLPESLFSTMASVQGLSDMALGNALGSILCNTGLIAGFLILLRPIPLENRAVKNLISETLFLGTAFFVYVSCGLLFGGLTRWSGCLLLGLCFLFLLNTAHSSIRQKKKGTVSTALQQPSYGITDIIRLILEAAAIYLGGSLLVKYGPQLARGFGVPEVIISLTFVALGTSMPEFVTSLVALKKKHSSLSLGNILGADILNFLLVGGLSSVIRPIPYVKSVMYLELPFIFLLLFFLCIPSIRKKRVDRIQGLLLLLGYALYLFLIT